MSTQFQRSTRSNKYFCKRCRDLNWLIQCHCGKCDVVISRFNKYGRLKTIELGHNREGKVKGKQHPRYKDGQFLDKGYLYVYFPKHHLATRQGYVRKHRLIWEENNNACLLKGSHVHHINGNISDNRPENLQAMTHGQHTKLTHLNRSNKLL